MANRHTLEDLRYLQAMPLDIKVRITKQRIREWIREFGEDGVYVSFSGGKDSTVLLEIVRQDYQNVRAMFVDVPTQYPELKAFVKTFDNVDIVAPKISFVQVCEKYGFPLISKEVSECVYGARKYLRSIAENGVCGGGTPTDWKNSADKASLVGGVLHKQMEKGERSCRVYKWEYEKATGTGRFSPHSRKSRAGGSGVAEKPFDSQGSQELLQKATSATQDSTEQGKAKAEVTPKKDRSQFSCERYQFFLDAPFEISNQCCKVMKKDPAHKYAKETGRNSITAQMAEESKLRTQAWLKNSCNAFNSKNPISNPMSFWTEQDVLQYIYEHKLPICSVYGEVVKDTEVDGQMDITDFGDDIFVPKFKTTGCKRTGCMLCGFGCHLEKESRFLRLKETHPKMYALLDVVKNNGYTMRQAIEWINEHGGTDIKL